MSSGIWNEFWSDESTHEYWLRPAAEVIDFMQSQSPRTYPRVLDLGCGLGRHAIAFAEAGYDVSATDASEKTIEHLRRWRDRLGLSIATETCDMLRQPFPADSFDIVVAYNVIYHGSRESFALAAKEVRRLLRTRGLFFFTCPTRDDGKYGCGECLAPHTYAAQNSMTPGDVHYFADAAGLRELLQGFSIVSLRKDEGYWNNKGVSQFFSNWIVTAEKTE